MAARQASALIGAFSITALLWWLFTPGMLGLRDMVVIARPALSLGALGFGDLPARNAPQDGALALLGMAIPATWVAKAAILAAAIAGACAAARLGPAAVLVTCWNPFVIERLLQGQWSLVIAAWLIPALLHPRAPVRLLAAWACSITPTGAVLAAVLLLVTGRKKACLFTAACSLPWIIPSLLAAPAGNPTAAFLAHPSLTWLTGGGIWNADVRTDAALVPLACAALAALTVWRAPKRLITLAATSLVLVALLGTFTAWQAIPGAALFRDTAKLTYFALPAIITGAGAIRKPLLIALACALTIAQAPTAPQALSHLKGIPEADWPRSSGDLFIADSTGLVTYQGRVMVDPRLKANQAVEAGVLRVDGEVVDQPSPRYLAAQAASDAELREMGIGLRIDSGHSQPIGGTSARGWRYWLGLFLTSCWLLAWLVPATSSRKAKNSSPVRSQE